MAQPPEGRREEGGEMKTDEAVPGSGTGHNPFHPSFLIPHPFFLLPAGLGHHLLLDRHAEQANLGSESVARDAEQLACLDLAPLYMPEDLAKDDAIHFETDPVIKVRLAALQ
jgi:hypothetical protein